MNFWKKMFLAAAFGLGVLEGMTLAASETLPVNLEPQEERTWHLRNGAAITGTLNAEKNDHLTVQILCGGVPVTINWIDLSFKDQRFIDLGSRWTDAETESLHERGIPLEDVRHAKAEYADTAYHEGIRTIFEIPEEDQETSDFSIRLLRGIASLERGIKFGSLDAQGMIAYLDEVLGKVPSLLDRDQIPLMAIDPARENNPFALYVLGKYYSETVQDAEKAKALDEKAVEIFRSGLEDPQNALYPWALAVCYENNRGISPEENAKGAEYLKEKASEYLTLAANRGNVLAMENLGRNLSANQKAAEGLDPSALNNLKKR